MRKFLSKLFLYVLIVSLITLGIDLLYIKTVKEDDIIADVPNDIQICNLGSSHGLFDFNYQDVEGKYTCFNFALASQSLLYDYRILQHYRNKIRKGAVVFIPVSYFSFLGRPEYQDKTFASRNKRYYKFLPSKLITEYNWKTDVFVNYFPALSHESLGKLIKALLHLNKRSNKGADITKIDDNAMAAYKRHIAVKFDAKGERLHKQESFEAIYALIKLCREIGARPVMITTPYFHRYTEVIRDNDPKFFEYFYNVINDIVRNTGCEYYNYAFDDRFRWDYTMFWDSDHMSKKGARVFTDHVLREVLSMDIKTM